MMLQMPHGMNPDRPGVLVHLAAGIGNLVLATPLLVALQELGLAVDVWLSADYPQTADLLRPWSAVREVLTGAGRPCFNKYTSIIPATPPFYWPRFASHFSGVKNLVPRPPTPLFYQNEQAFYLSFARVLGFPPDRRPFCTLPIAPDDQFGATRQTVVLAPGCKTGEMAAKRWPHFAELAERLQDVVVVGTADDLRHGDGRVVKFPAHVRSFVDRLTLRQTAELIAGAGLLIGNDSGLSHVAAAVGTPCLLIFGPTPHHVFGQLCPQVSIIRSGLNCEPCWFGSRFRACAKRIDCLRKLSVAHVAEAALSKV